MIARSHLTEQDLPVAVCPDGTILKNPSEQELGRCLGMVAAPRADTLYDVAIVGAGPAGLSTAVYAASEGLSVIVLDARAFGGQAGASARIGELFRLSNGDFRAGAHRPRFRPGAEIRRGDDDPAEVKSLDCSRKDAAFGLVLESGERLRARAVVIASGARYRRLALENLGDFEGRGVSYWASSIEARLCKDQEVVLVGGGNSAGQAAVFLSVHASKVRMMIRSNGLAASMSRYLIDRIKATSNIELMTETEIVALEGRRETGS